MCGILLTSTIVSNCACSAATSASADCLAALAAALVTRHILSLVCHSIQANIATVSAAKAVTALWSACSQRNPRNCKIPSDRVAQVAWPAGGVPAVSPDGRQLAFAGTFEGKTKDGVPVAKEIELSDKFENMGAQLVKEVASRTRLWTHNQ